MTSTGQQPAAQADKQETCEHEWIGIVDGTGIVTHLQCEQCNTIRHDITGVTIIAVRHGGLTWESVGYGAWRLVTPRR